MCDLSISTQINSYEIWTRISYRQKTKQTIMLKMQAQKSKKQNMTLILY